MKQFLWLIGNIQCLFKINLPDSELVSLQPSSRYRPWSLSPSLQGSIVSVGFSLVSAEHGEEGCERWRECDGSTRGLQVQGGGKLWEHLPWRGPQCSKWWSRDCEEHLPRPPELWIYRGYQPVLGVRLHSEKAATVGWSRGQFLLLHLIKLQGTFFLS